MTNKKAIDLALKALKCKDGFGSSVGMLKQEAIKALEALAKQEHRAQQFNQQVLDEWTAEYKKEADYWKARHDILVSSLRKSNVEPVCDKDPRECYSVRCQLGNKCKNSPSQQRTWLGLTDAVNKSWYAYQTQDFIDGALWAEAKLKEKNVCVPA